jgi:hypothetical protein
MMDVRFTLRSLQQVLDKIPFDQPALGPVDLDFSTLATPYHVKDVFKVSIEYENGLPYEASCSIYSPNHKVTIVIIMNQEYEEALRRYQDGDVSFLGQCCLRRELYCHEVCHLIAIIRAYSDNRSSEVRKEFLGRIKEKFVKSVGAAQKTKTVPWEDYVAVEARGVSPSAFDKDHFRYDDENLSYFKLYEELMLPEDRMAQAAQNLSIIAKTKRLTYEDVGRETFVSKEFFDLFPDKLGRLNELIVEELNK